MKTCRRCHRDLPRDAFGKNRERPDGLTVYCRECTRAYLRDWKVRERQREDDRYAV